MHRLGLVTVLILLSMPLTVIAAEPAAFEFSREIRTGDLEREEIVAVPLDSDVYAATRDGFPDFRIFDGDGREVPFVMQKATETRQESIRKTWLADDVSLKPREDGSLEIRVSLDDDDPQPDGLKLVTPLKNYEQRVRVFGGDGEEPLVSDALVFDYSQYMDVANRVVGLPDSDHRAFRIVIDNVTAEQESQLLELTRRLRGGDEAERTERFTVRRRPFRIDRIEFFRETTRERFKGEKTREYPVAEFDVEENTDEQQTRIAVRTRRQPLTAFVLETPARNFSRRAVVQVPISQGVRTDWRDVGETTISRMDFRDLNREELQIGFPEQRREQYRIVIHNRDSPPLKITGVKTEGRVYRAVFLAEPGVTYEAYYGSETVEEPSYDAAAVLAALKGENYEPVQGELGEQTANPAAEPPGFGARRLLNNPFVWGGLICVLVALLAWGLYAAARRVDRLPEE